MYVHICVYNYFQGILCLEIRIIVYPTTCDIADNLVLILFIMAGLSAVMAQKLIMHYW